MRVKNGKLYSALSKLFGAVQVANAGEDATVVAPTVSAVQRRIGRRRMVEVSGGEQYRINCPFCGDRNFHLYISHLWGATITVGSEKHEVGTGLVRCFRRECLADAANREAFRSKLLPVLATVGGSTELVATNAQADVDPLRMAGVELPPGSALACSGAHPDVDRWLVETRGFHANDLRMFHVHTALCTIAGVSGLPCAVFPVLFGGSMVGWQARPIGYTKGWTIPKYVNNHGFRKSWTLYNLDQAKDCPLAVVVEGVTDAIRVGKEGVALFGKEASKAQETLLRRFWHGKVLKLVPDMNDPDSAPRFRKLAQRLTSDRTFQSVDVTILPEGKDPGALTREELWTIIRK